MCLPASSARRCAVFRSVADANAATEGLRRAGQQAGCVHARKAGRQAEAAAGKIAARELGDRPGAAAPRGPVQLTDRAFSAVRQNGVGFENPFEARKERAFIRPMASVSVPICRTGAFKADTRCPFRGAPLRSFCGHKR